MYPLREKFVKRDKQGGVWIYACAFGLSTVAVEASQPDDFPLFVKGIALEEGGQTSVTVGAAAYTFNSSLEVQLPQQNVFAVIVTTVGGAGLIQGTDYSVDRVNGIITAIAGRCDLRRRDSADRIHLCRSGYCDGGPERAD